MKPFFLYRDVNKKTTIASHSLANCPSANLAAKMTSNFEFCSTSNSELIHGS